MKKIRVSAPGKLMLFGEHAVVYNQPSLVTAINQRLFIEAEKISENKILIDAPEMEISNFVVSFTDLNKRQPQQIRFLIEAIKNFLEKYKIRSGLKIRTESQFSAQYGFGSSSAVTVCSIKALSELFEIKMKKKEIFDFAYQTVLNTKGIGSGVDIAAAIYGGVIYFLTGGQIIEPLKVKKIPLVVGYTGFKTSTSEILNRVKSEMEKNPAYYEALYNDISHIVKKARLALENSNWQEAGRLMKENQDILRKFKVPSKQYGVSSKIIEKLIEACQRTGAWGTKLSGAGVGDCIIALGEDKERIEKAIKEAGGVPISVDIDYQGLKVESKL